MPGRIDPPESFPQSAESKHTVELKYSSETHELLPEAEMW